MQSPSVMIALTREFAIFSFQFAICNSEMCPQPVLPWLVCQRTASVAFHASGFLRDLDPDTCANTRRAGFDHRARVIDVLDATRCLYTKFRSDCAPHQSDVGNGRAAFRESG